MQSVDPGRYDVEYETIASRNMLEKRIPAELNKIKHALIQMEQRKTCEPWQLAVIVDLTGAIERNCEQLLETMSKDGLPVVAWVARNLLELLVWVRYCGASRDNAWRFHEDALRDTKGLVDLHAKSCAAMGLVDETSEIAAQKLRQVASENLGFDEIGSDYRRVSKAAETPGVGLKNLFGPFNQTLSKFAHPTAGLVHGITHQVEICRQLQTVFTTQGVYCAAQATLALGSQLGVPQPPNM